MALEVVERKGEWIELRRQVCYWRVQHGRAVERASVWEKKAKDFESLTRRQEAQIIELTQQKEALRAKVSQLQKQVFGRKTEQTKGASFEEEGGDLLFFETGFSKKRKRGKQVGAKGYGRRRREWLPTEEIYHDIPVDEQSCPKCNKPWIRFPSTEDSEEIHWEVRLVRRIHKRSRYLATCNCRVVAGIITAQCPAKLIPKGMFSTDFWVRLVLEKFLFQRPLYRIRQVLAQDGLSVSQGTLTGGLRRIGELVQPVYAGIVERNRGSDHWHMDETGWRVFEEVNGKRGYRWWLWVIISGETCVYLLEPSRSAQVPKDHLGENTKGIISADRYVVYQNVGDGIVVAFCWSHIRRDFRSIGNGYPKLRVWAEDWITLINNLFVQNAKRVAMAFNSDEFNREDKLLRTAIDLMAKKRDKELAETTLHPAKQKALERLRKHWEGATLFVDHPEIPMDNNEAERRLRNPVVGRKNYYGSGSIWSGMLTAMLFTILQTYLKNHIDPKKFLLAYFQACAQNNGKPPKDIDPWLPWNLAQEQRALWQYPRNPP